MADVSDYAIQYKARPVRTSAWSDHTLYRWLLYSQDFIMISLKMTVGSSKFKTGIVYFTKSASLALK